MKRRAIRRMLLSILCLFLALNVGCGGNVETTAHNTDENLKGTTVSHEEELGQIYTEPPYIMEDDDPLAAEIQAALTEKKAKLIWAEDCFAETRQEAKLWHFTFVDCNSFFEELLKDLFPDALVENREETLDGTVIMLQSGQDTLRCISDVNGRFINLFHLPSELGEALLPKAADWLAQKTGLEQRKWTDYDSMRTDAIACYTGYVDGIQVGALYCLQLNNQLQGNYGVYLASSGSVQFHSPISVGEEAGTVKLNGSFSLEDLRATLEFDFDPSLPEITVYRSCRLCYLIHEEKGLLVPVWWVKGIRYNLETGEGRPFEIVFDAETGSRYRFGGA